MPGQDDFIEALYATVLAGTGAAGGGASGVGYVCLEWPGLPIELADYANPLTGDNPTGSPAALEAFSTLVDELPALSPLYQATGASLQTIYRMILGATVDSGSVVAQAFATAKEQFDSLVRGSVTDPLAIFHPAYATPRTWADASGAAQWATVQVGGGARPPPLPPVLRPVLDRGLAKPTWRFSGESPPTVVRPKLPAELAAASPSSARLGPAAPGAGTDAPPAIAARPPAAVQAARQATATLRPQAAAPATAAPASLAPVLARRLDVLQLNPKAVPIRPPEEQAAGISDLRATLQMLHIGIKRSWFDPTVLRLPGWSLGGIERGFFSNGSADADPGLCPLVPTSVIAVRNVRISGTWSAGDRAAAARAVAGGKQAAFGPFTLATPGRVEGSFDGSTLALPGVQVVAWICSRMPVLPP